MIEEVLYLILLGCAAVFAVILVTYFTAKLCLDFLDVLEIHRRRNRRD